MTDENSDGIGTQTITPEQLHAELARWLCEHCDAWQSSRPGGPRPPTIEEATSVQAALFDAGYVRVDWPVESGGRGLTAAHQQAVARALSDYALPTVMLTVGVGMCAPTIRAHGSPEQRDDHLRPLLRGDDVWCQLFSEPGAGSDLAGLATRAVVDGDEWVLNGQKVWTSGAQHADFGLLLARTDPDAPKHRGITAFLLPMHTTGVTVRPLRQITGEAGFNEVFLDDVVIDDSYRLGPIGEGWRVATTTLSSERIAVGAGNRHRRREPAAVAASRLLAAVDRGSDPALKEQVGRVIALDRAVDCLAVAIRTGVEAGRDAGPLGSIGKLATVRLVDMLTATNLMIGGLDAVAWDDGEIDGSWSAQALAAPGGSIGGGTNDIQRNIVGERLLGLPREPGFDKSTPFNKIPKSG